MLLDISPICHNVTMKINKKLLTYYYYVLRSQMWRAKRMIFISPAEARFIEIMGGKVVKFDWITHPKTGFNLGVVVSLGKVLRRERIEREVRVGKCFVDFGTTNKYYKRGIEIDGRDFHMDVVKELERDEYCWQYGWRLLHIQAADLYQCPDLVQRRVLTFLAK